jgi:hypothetical protein
MASTLKVNEIQHTGGTTALTIDNGGRVLQPTKPAFRAYRVGGWQSVAASGVWYDLTFNLEDHDIGGHYNTSTYTFTCPSTGVYFFGAQYQHDANASAQVRLFANGTTELAYADNSVQGDMSQVYATHYMTAGHTVVAQAKLGNVNADDWYATLQASFFFGYLIG